MKLLYPLCLGLTLAANPALAAFEAYKITDPAHSVKLDGVVDDAVWGKAAARGGFFESQPADKIAAKVNTEVRIAYDAKYMYVAVKAFDPKPHEIRAPFGRRDKISGDQDFIGLFIDPGASRQAAQIIYFNPRGAFTDGNFTNTNGEDVSPDFDFSIATARFDGGWSAELRIPFTSISYVAGQSAPWNLLVMRNMTRDTRYKMWSGQVTRSSACLLCFSEPINGLAGLPTGLNWSATPQLVMRRGTDTVAGAPRQNNSDIALSLDVKIKPDSATVIDATINPDFSQIELDAPQLSGNTRFGLFVQEKRPFFLEGSDMFQTPFRAISTRTMSDPAWGARYTRRDAGRDLTVLTTRDAGGGLVQLPNAYHTDFAAQDFASQATVARANFKRGKLSLGVTGTDRTLFDERGYNRVLGPDFTWQRSDEERVRGQLLLSATTAQPDAAGKLVKGARTTGHAGVLEWSREEEKWGAWASVEEVSDGFRADNGFFSQVGYRLYVTEFSAKLGKRGPLNDLNLYFHSERKADTLGAAIVEDTTIGAWMKGPRDIEFNIRLKPKNKMRVKQHGELFETAQVWARIDASPGRTLARVSAELELGDQIDIEGARLGRGGLAMLYARLRPFEWLEFEPTYSATWVDGRGALVDGRRLYTEQALQLKGIYHIGARDTVRMILQRARTKRDPSLYANPVEGESSRGTTSFVYGHTATLGRAAYVGVTLSKGETPGHAPRRQQNELFVKLSWQI
ncbi:carbohydrate binding family 9 domain-containing protein [Massilia glaciei]|nr:carbohydrate binding family 9 domain-containing protein [Massilia glaciei]